MDRGEAPRGASQAHVRSQIMVFLETLLIPALLVSCRAAEVIVVDEGGEPVVGATVMGTTLSIGGQFTTTNGRGEARIPWAIQPTQWISVSKDSFETEPSIDIHQALPIRIVLTREPLPGSAHRSMLLESRDVSGGTSIHLLTHPGTVELIESRLKTLYRVPDASELSTLSKNSVLMISEMGDVAFQRPPVKSYVFYIDRTSHEPTIVRDKLGEHSGPDLLSGWWVEFLRRAKPYTGTVRSGQLAGEK